MENEFDNIAATNIMLQLAIERIAALEDLHNVNTPAVANWMMKLTDLDIRTKELEKQIEDIIPRVWSAEQKGCIAMDAIECNGRFSKKTPHKCPLCYGEGKVKHPLNGLVMCECVVCEGKCIVWG